jgi:hypothetical protein
MPISYGTIYEHTLVMVTILAIVQFPPNLHTCDIAKDFFYWARNRIMYVDKGCWRWYNKHGSNWYYPWWMHKYLGRGRCWHYRMCMIFVIEMQLSHIGWSCPHKERSLLHLLQNLGTIFRYVNSHCLLSITWGALSLQIGYIWFLVLFPFITIFLFLWECFNFNGSPKFKKFRASYFH